MRYVGIINFQDFVLVLREDGKLYRVTFNFYSGQAIAHQASDLKVEQLLQLPQGRD